MRRFSLAMMSGLLLLATAWLTGQEAGPAAGISLQTRLSRTLIRVGEAFEYRVRIQHPHSVDFVTQELEAGIALRPFQIRTFRLEQRRQGEDSILELVLELVCYEPPGPRVIPSFSLFYYPSEVLSQAPGLQQDVPAMSLAVPPQPIQVGSTLLGEGDALRDSVSLMRFSRREWILPGLAAGLLVVLAAGLSFWGIRRAIRRSRLDPGEDPRRVQAEAVQALERLAQTGQEAGIYLEVSKRLRGFLESRYGIASQALTPAEIQRELKYRVDGSEFGPAVERLLTECERMFFDPGARAGEDPKELRSRAVKLVRSSPEAVDAAG